MSHWRKPLPNSRFNAFAVWTTGMWIVLQEGRWCGFRPSAVMCVPENLFLTLGRANALGTSERNVRFGHLVVESPRYHES
jgi:hypothetical protein